MSGKGPMNKFMKNVMKEAEKLEMDKMSEAEMEDMLKNTKSLEDLEKFISMYAEAQSLCNSVSMTNEEKQLLLKDLCARLPYKVKGVYARTDIKNLSICEITAHLYCEMEESFNGKEKYEFIPYLRPMSSMTEEEENELVKDAVISGYNDDSVFNSYIITDWLNAHHFDFRGLIPMGLALEAPKGMYKTD